MAVLHDMLIEMKLLPWSCILLDNQQYLSKFSTTSISYCFILSDLNGFYLECLSSSEIGCKFEELNPGIEMPLHRILSLLEKIFLHPKGNSISEIQSLTKNANNEILLRLETIVAGIPFIWQFRLSECKEKLLKEQLLLPLVGMIAELQQKQNFLISLIKKKDREIEDYKTAGAKVSSKYLETSRFDENQFFIDQNCPKTLSETTRDAVKSTFDHVNEDFYVAVATAHTLIEEQQNKSLEDDQSVEATKDEKGKEKMNNNYSTSKSKKRDEDKEIARRKELEQRLLAKPAKKKKKIAF